MLKKVLFSYVMYSSLSLCLNASVSLAYFHFEEELHFFELSKNNNVLVEVEKDQEKLISYLMHLQDKKLLGQYALSLTELECVLNLPKNTLDQFLKKQDNALVDRIILSIKFFYLLFDKKEPVLLSKLKANEQLFLQILEQNTPTENEEKELSLLFDQLKIMIQQNLKVENSVLLNSKKLGIKYGDLAHILFTIYEMGLGEFPKDSPETQQEAFKWLKIAAQHKNSQSVKQLGYCYETGKWVTMDKEEAFKLYQTAFALGDQSAEICSYPVYISLMELHKNKLDDTILSRIKECSKVYKVLYRNLSYLYEMGLGEFPKDSPETQQEAFKWLSLAYENGDKTAAFSLATYYAMGQGVQEDKKKAIELFQVAASIGNKKAEVYRVMFSGNISSIENKKMDIKDLALLKHYASHEPQIPGILCNIYEMGLGEFPKDSQETQQEASKWMMIAHQGGNVQMAFYLAGRYAEGVGVEKNRRTAFALFQQATALGDLRAQKSLLTLEAEFALEENKKVNPVVIEKLKSEYHERRDIQHLLANIYDKGLGEFPAGSDETYQESVRWIKRAKDKGDPEAIVLLGVNYTHGRGVTQDEEKALELFEEGAKKGATSGYKFSLIIKAEIARKKNMKVDPETLAALKENAKTDVDCCMTLGDVYRHGTGEYDAQSSEAYAAAIQEYKKACEMDPASVCTTLGLYYAAGLFVEKDYQEALKYFSQGAALGIQECIKYKLIIELHNQKNAGIILDQEKIKRLREFSKEDESLIGVIEEITHKVESSREKIDSTETYQEAMSSFFSQEASKPIVYVDYKK